MIALIFITLMRFHYTDI